MKIVEPDQNRGRSDACVDSAASVAEEQGIDLGLIAENLRLTPLERMRQHDETVRQILAVQSRIGVRSSNEPGL